MNPIIKKIIPFVVAVIAFYGISAFFFAPEAFQGKTLQQVDTEMGQAMNREAREYYAKDGKVRQWTNTMFSGMPTTMIYQKNTGNLVRHIYYGSLLWKDVKSPSIDLYVAMLSMFLALLLLGIDWRIALIGGIGFGFGSYNMEILEAGHVTKMMAIGYFGLVVVSAWYAFNRNMLLGAAIFAVSLGMQIYATHYQITYYSLIIIFILGIVELVKAIKNQTLPKFVKTTALMIAFGILCAGTNAAKLWTTYEYSQETIRGKSDLKGGSDGLGKDYVFSWSYGIGESMTLLIPDFMGGGSSQSYENTNTYKKVEPQIKAGLIKQGLTGKALKNSVNQQVASLFYDGDQPFVGMGVYMGIIVFFLMVLGIVMAQGPTKWWLLASLLAMLSIAWGRHFSLNEVWYNILPLFNKFRSLSMALSLVQGLAVMLGALGLQAFFRKETSDEQRKKGLYIAGGITLGILVLTLLLAGSFNYSGPKDARYGAQLGKLLEADRLSLLRKDAMRSLLFALLGIAPLFLFMKRKISASITTFIILAFVTVDMWSVDRRIIHADKFKTPKHISSSAQPAEVDKQILKDKDIHYRVMDLRVNPFNNASAAMFHKLSGGYHPAKIRRYNDIIDKYLKTPGKYLNVLGMLNTKYIIQNQQNGAVPIPLREKALGNAWFVKSYRVLESADAELNELGNIDPKQEAIFDKAYAKALDGFNINFDSTATIKLVGYDPDVMEYEYSSKTPQLAVFSEIYYPEKKGWSMTVDGEPVPILKADYLLRSGILPAGNHKLVMKFHPKSYYLGERISLFSSILLLLGLFAGFYFSIKNHDEESTLYSLPELDKTQAPAPVKPTKPMAQKNKKGKRKK